MDVVKELLNLDNYYGCGKQIPDDLGEKYDYSIENHIYDILEKHKKEYVNIDRDYISYGDYYTCWIFSFVFDNYVVKTVSLEIEYC